MHDISVSPPLPLPCAPLADDFVSIVSGNLKQGYIPPPETESQRPVAPPEVPQYALRQTLAPLQSPGGSAYAQAWDTGAPRARPVDVGVPYGNPQDQRGQGPMPVRGGVPDLGPRPPPGGPAAPPRRMDSGDVLPGRFQEPPRAGVRARPWGGCLAWCLPSEEAGLLHLETCSRK